MLRLSRCAIAVAALLLAGCATVVTRVAMLDPAVSLAPTSRVEILLEKPQRPYREIAFLESRGIAGGSEVELLEDAREKARALGADAIVRLELEHTVQPPVVVYEPLFAPFYYGFPYRRYPMIYPGYFGEYRVVGGGTAYTLRTLAIRYEAQAVKPE
jgi:hypothetical protein